MGRAHAAANVRPPEYPATTSLSPSRSRLRNSSFHQVLIAAHRTREENDLIREKKALAKLERIKKLKISKPLDLVTAKLSKKKGVKKEASAKLVPVKAQAEGDESYYRVSAIPVSRRASTYAPPSPGGDYGQYRNHPGFEYGHDFGYESTPGEMEMSPIDGYFGGSHYSSTSSLNNAMENYSFHRQQSYYPQESPYPVTPESESMPNSPTYSIPSQPQYYQEPAGEPLFPTKDHFAHRPSLSRAFSSPQSGQGFAYPAPPSPLPARQPTGLCMYIGDEERGRHPASSSWTSRHEEIQHQQSLQSWTFPGITAKRQALPSQRMANELPPMFSQQPSPSFRPTHSRVASSPLAHEFKPIYRGPIDWSSRPLMPFPAQALPPAPTRPGHERTYSEFGTLSTTTVQTVRMAEICQTNA